MTVENPSTLTVAESETKQERKNAALRRAVQKLRGANRYAEHLSYHGALVVGDLTPLKLAIAHQLEEQWFAYQFTSELQPEERREQRALTMREVWARLFDHYADPETGDLYYEDCETFYLLSRRSEAFQERELSDEVRDRLIPTRSASPFRDKIRPSQGVIPPPPEKLRRLVKPMRAQGLPIATSSNEKGGYWFATTVEETGEAAAAKWKKITSEARELLTLLAVVERTETLARTGQVPALELPDAADALAQLIARVEQLDLSAASIDRRRPEDFARARQLEYGKRRQAKREAVEKTEIRRQQEQATDRIRDPRLLGVEGVA
jgi:hypothetical protein